MRKVLPVAAVLAGAALTLGACEKPADDTAAMNDTAAMPADNTMMDTNAVNDMATNDMATNDMATNDMATNDADADATAQ